MSSINTETDPIDNALNKYVNHPSVLKIKEYFRELDEFNFSPVTLEEMEKEIRNLNN